MQQRSAQRRRRHTELSEDRGDGKRVGDVGVATFARLSLVHPLGDVICLLDGRDIALGVSVAIDLQQRIENRVR